MSAATQNYVEQLQKDLKEAQERIKALEATVRRLEEESALHELNESMWVDHFKKQSHICTAGNNGEQP